MVDITGEYFKKIFLFLVKLPMANAVKMKGDCKS